MSENKVPKNNPAVTAVLQWLSYSFWGWTVILVGWLVWLVAASNIYGSVIDAPALIPGIIAAVVILFTIAFVTDSIYSKREIEQKTGAAMVLMVIHAVVFGLLAVGALVAIAINSVTLLVESGSSEMLGATTIAFAVAFVLYLLILARIAKPFLLQKLRTIFRLSLLAVVLVIIVLAIVGPVMDTVRTKDDRAVQQATSTLTYSIQRYTTEENKLPVTLEALTESSAYSDDDPQALLELSRKGLVKYTPNTKTSSEESSSSYRSYETTTTFYYELCQTYSNESFVKNSGKYNYRNTLRVGQNCKQETATYSDSVKYSD
jgi:type II secretory pathway pseudopilin PulG